MKNMILILLVVFFNMTANSQVMIDKGHFFSDQEMAQLKAYAQNIKDKYTVETLIYTTMDLQGQSPHDYIMSLGDQYKVGKKGVNNGIIILLSKKERKLQILNGMGVEWIISDVETQNIVNQMIAFFKKQDYFGGLKKGLELIEQHVSSADWNVKSLNLSELTKDDLGKIIKFSYSNHTGEEEFLSAMDTDPQFSNDFHITLHSGETSFSLFYSKHMNKIIELILQNKDHDVYARLVNWNTKNLELMGVE